jgi:hypothetical protein
MSRLLGLGYWQQPASIIGAKPGDPYVPKTPKEPDYGKFWQGSDIGEIRLGQRQIHCCILVSEALEQTWWEYSAETVYTIWGCAFTSIRM